MSDKLFEDVKVVSQILNDTVNYGYSRWDSMHTEMKDTHRIVKILSKPEEKQLRAAEVMANAITHTDKAVRRARACAEEWDAGNAEMVEAMTKVFLKRAVLLHVAEIDPGDIVKLKQMGAI